jgi:hypothetical protein
MMPFHAQVESILPAFAVDHLILSGGFGTRDAPDTVLAGYPANLKIGYRISGQISGEAGYRISGWIIGLTKRLIVKYHVTTTRKAKFTNVSFFQF